MVTQSVISLVNKDNQTIVKIIAGCNGFNAPKLIKRITADELRNIHDIYIAAGECQFGCDDCLVVMDYKANTGGKLPPSYRETFNNPNFNPRWSGGTVNHTYIITAEEY